VSHWQRGTTGLELGLAPAVLYTSAAYSVFSGRKKETQFTAMRSSYQMKHITAHYGGWTYVSRQKQSLNGWGHREFTFRTML